VIQLGGGWLTCNCLTVRESGEVLERWPLGPAGDNTARATQPLVERALSLYLQLLRTRYGVQFIALFQYHCRRVSLGGGGLVMKVGRVDRKCGIKIARSTLFCTLQTKVIAS